jgi:DNA-binding transcriptional MerR regulator
MQSDERTEASMTANTGLTSRQAAQALGVQYRALMRWVEEGYIAPEVPTECTHYERPDRRWHDRHIREARAFVNLLHRGVRMATIGRALEHVRQMDSDPFTSDKFLALSSPRNGAHVTVCDAGGVLELVRAGQLVLPLALLASEAEPAATTAKQ